MHNAQCSLFSFVTLQETHFPLLVAWLNMPHIRKWWNNQISWTFEHVKEKYTPYTQKYKFHRGDRKPIHAFIICYAQEPIGYIQYYSVHDFLEDDRVIISSQLPTSCAALDWYIGDTNYVDKKLSHHILTQFLEEKVRPHFDAVMVDPDINNTAAIRSYKKAGFQTLSIHNQHDQQSFLIVFF